VVLRDDRQHRGDVLVLEDEVHESDAAGQTGDQRLVVRTAERVADQGRVVVLLRAELRVENAARQGGCPGACGLGEHMPPGCRVRLSGTGHPLPYQLLEAALLCHRRSSQGERCSPSRGLATVAGKERQTRECDPR
jgi:hypothetical protein